MRMTEKEFREFKKSHSEIAAGTKNAAKNKFRNKTVYIYDGLPSYEKIPDKRYEAVFDSVKEYKRYNELKVLEKAGQISKLERQKKLVIQPAFTYKDEKIREIAYKADFFYCDSDGNFVVEDVKGYDRKKQKFITTKDFSLKWKLLKAKYPEYIFNLF